jgi:hypothetical protein
MKARKKSSRSAGKKPQKNGQQEKTSTDKPPDDIFGFLAGKGTIVGDIVSPILSPEEWGDLYPSPSPRRRSR